MKKMILILLALPVIHYTSFAQTKTLTVDANDILNNNTKIVAQTSAGQIFFTGHQIGSTYTNPMGIFRAWTDNPNGTANYFFDGVVNATTNFSVRADGQGYFAGRVGIGTNTPQTALTVVNSTPVIQLFDKDINSHDGSSIGKLAFGAGFEYASIEASRVGANFDDLSSLQFKTSWATGAGGDGANVERMRINYNGNVGIGTINPQNKLDVNGTVHSKSVLIDLNGWSDYVFHKDYKLPSLADLKNYIDQNQHLPEIPSEQEMVKKGLDVGEMNKLLMKKVEELTLYLIEMKAEIKQLQKQNELLKNKTN